MKSTGFIILIFCVTLNSGLASDFTLDFMSWTMPNTPNHIEAKGQYVFASAGAFITIDIANEQNPLIVNCLRPLEAGVPMDFTIHENYAYVAWSKQGIRVIDITNPVEPVILSDFESEFNKYSNLVLDYPRLYALADVDNQQFHIQIFNVSNPEKLSLMGDLNLADINIGYKPEMPESSRFPFSFVLNGDNIYLTSGPPVKSVSDNHAKLHVIEVGYVSSPNCTMTIDLGETDMSRSNLNIAQNEQCVYVTGFFLDGPTALKIIDFTNPLNPIVSGWVDHFRIIDIDRANDFLYLTDEEGGLHIANISNATNPQTVSELFLPVPDYIPRHFLIKVAEQRAYLYFWDHYSAYSVNISDPYHPVLINETGIEFGHALTDVSASNSYVFTSVWDWKQIYSIKMAEPTFPEITERTVVTTGFSWGLDVKGNYAYLATGVTGAPDLSPGGLMIFDISNPDNPQPRGFCAQNKNNQELEVYVDSTENRAYVISGDPVLESAGLMKSSNPGMRIIDVSNPDEPFVLGCYSLPDTNHQCTDISKQGLYAYISAGQGGVLYN